MFNVYVMLLAPQSSQSIQKAIPIGISFIITRNEGMSNLKKKRGKTSQKKKKEISIENLIYKKYKKVKRERKKN
jgi:hypothetical protein